MKYPKQIPTKDCIGVRNIVDFIMKSTELIKLKYGWAIKMVNTMTKYNSDTYILILNKNGSTRISFLAFRDDIDM